MIFPGASHFQVDVFSCDCCQFVFMPGSFAPRPPLRGWGGRVSDVAALHPKELKTDTEMGLCPKPRQRSAAGSRPPGRAGPLMLGVRELNWIIQHLFEHQYAWHVHRPIIVMRAGPLNHLINPTSGGSDPTAARWRGLGWNPITSLVFYHLNARRVHNLP